MRLTFRHRFVELGRNPLKSTRFFAGHFGGSGGHGRYFVVGPLRIAFGRCV